MSDQAGVVHFDDWFNARADVVALKARHAALQDARDAAREKQDSAEFDRLNALAWNARIEYESLWLAARQSPA